MTVCSLQEVLILVSVTSIKHIQVHMPSLHAYERSNMEHRLQYWSRACVVGFHFKFGLSM